MSTQTKDQIIQELKSILAEAPALHAPDCNRNAHAGPCKCWLAKRDAILSEKSACNHDGVTLHLTGAVCNECLADLRFDGKSGRWITEEIEDTSIESKIKEFTREHQGQPQAPEAELKLIALAEEYHRRTEEYDRTVCTGPIIKGTIQAANAVEMSMAIANARIIRAELTVRAKAIGFEMVDLYEKIQTTREFKIRHGDKTDAPRFTFERPSR